MPAHANISVMNAQNAELRLADWAETELTSTCKKALFDT